jgi:hypothetical protein
MGYGRRSLSDVVLLSLTASLNPTLLTVTTIMLMLDRPRALMLGYLLGAYITSITLGLIIVFSLSSSSAVDTTKHTFSPAADIALGVLALIAAFVIGRERPRRPKPDKGPPRWQRELSKGSPRIAFVIGMALTLPGASYLAALISIHKLDYATAPTVLLVVGVNLVMLWIIELPLIGFFLAPERTRTTVDRAKAWVFERGRTFAVRGFAVIGLLLILKGVIGLIS